jgi:tryptophan halogenase
MLLSKIKKIIIFGGGSSGWLTAAFLSSNLRIPCEIELIEDSKNSPIGVGEGTQPYTSAFLSACGIEPLEWMKPSRASFKYGVELVGWTDNPYFVDNDNISSHVLASNLFAHDYFIDKPPSDYFNWLPAYQLAKNNISPKIKDFDVNITPGLLSFGAVHFSAFDIIEAIKKKILNKITHTQVNIVDIKQDSNGISSLVDADGNNYKADLYIDCSGFSAILSEKILGTQFISYENTLPCNRAVALPTAYTDPEKECVPYTKATAMSAGWRWTIPNFQRIGNGYVYSDKFITPEDAEKELRTAIGNFDNEARHLKMKCGKLKKIAVKNVCAVGLSAGFVEPLEATGITFTTKVVEWIASSLNETNNIWNDNAKNFINYNFDEMSTEIHAFIWCHYYFSTKNDTEFWKKFKNISKDQIPSSINDILINFFPFPRGPFYLNPSSMFHQGHWFSMLHACDRYQHVKKYVSEEQEKYLEYFITTHNNRCTNAKKTFPNHYQHLKTWYNE